jgi:hypothetical protein
VVVAGDDRYVGNVFLGGDATAAYEAKAEGVASALFGTAGYDGHPASFEEYLARIDEQAPGDHQRFLGMTQPVYARENVYVSGAQPFSGERDPLVLGDATASVVDEGDAVYLETELPPEFGAALVGVVTGRDLERVRFADADFEEPDGSPAVLDVDLLGERKSPGRKSAAGPVAALAAGSGRVRVW